MFTVLIESRVYLGGPGGFLEEDQIPELKPLLSLPLSSNPDGVAAEAEGPKKSSFEVLPNLVREPIRQAVLSPLFGEGSPGSCDVVLPRRLLRASELVRMDFWGISEPAVDFGAAMLS